MQLPASAAEERRPRLADLTAPVRQRVDHLAMQQPAETHFQKTIHLGDDIANWLISRLTLPAEDELRDAQDQHKKALARYRKLPTLEPVKQVWSKLLQTLPPHLGPTDFSWTLTVLDIPEPTCFTCGGGFVYISRPLLDALLSDARRGPTAAAYVLAQQLGHIGLKHTRRGWLTVELDREQRDQDVELRMTMKQLQALLETHIEKDADQVRFRYTRHQQYDADRFALHLCRNAGLDLDQAIDGMRLLAALQQPRIVTDEKYQPDEAPPEEPEERRRGDTLYYPLPLMRLKYLLQERDGLVDESPRYGLFLYDPDSEELTRCKNQSIEASARPIIFVHGLHGSLHTFQDFLHAFAEEKDLRGRPLLAFRYPNNESLSRCGEYLAREMARVVAGPKHAFFVCHSAGGLVFRYYAEARKGGFDRAVLLSTPNEGSHMASLKFLADLSGFAGELRGGLPGVVARTVEEGHGAILYDLRPDSLFLRYLGHNKELAARYHVFSGEPLRPRRIIALGAGLLAAKHYLHERAIPRIHSRLLRRLAEQTVNDWHLPPEITQGDLVVSARSALLEDAGHATRTGLRHEELLHDEDIVDRILADILGK
jgi:pimeloyl-ACP methyl ester carboxylesterase